VVNQLTGGVKVVQNHVRVALVARSEHGNFEVFIGLAKTFNSVGSDVDAGIDHLASREGYWKNRIRVASLNIISAVDKRFIQIEDEGLAAEVSWTLVKVHLPRL
jgi:hypothetical protein